MVGDMRVKYGSNISKSRAALMASHDVNANIEPDKYSAKDPEMPLSGTAYTRCLKKPDP